MRTVPLGLTGVDVSALCLGAMYFGSRTDEAASRDILDGYVARGGSFIDTANMYARWIEGCSGGDSEALLGRWIGDRGNRNDLFIATKMGVEYQNVARGTKAKDVVAECEKSLKRLGVETIDLFYAHFDDRNTPLEETLGALDSLIQSGKVRFIGASNHAAWRLQKAIGVSQANEWTPYCCIQQRHTFARPRAGIDMTPQIPAGPELLDMCASEGLTLVAYSPLTGGAYARTDRALPEPFHGRDTDARLAALAEVVAETGASPNAVILSWMMHSKASIVPIIGVGSTAQLSDNLAALDVALSAEQMEKLDQAAG